MFEVLFLSRSFGIKLFSQFKIYGVKTLIINDGGGGGGDYDEHPNGHILVDNLGMNPIRCGLKQ